MAPVSPSLMRPGHRPPSAFVTETDELTEALDKGGSF
jgi:hypothetical protein